MTEHEDVRALLPELALNAAAGEERAVALEHLSGCPACRAELAQLAQLLDDVLLLAPAVAPPDGFAERVLARTVGDRDPAVAGLGDRAPVAGVPRAGVPRPGPPDAGVPGRGVPAGRLPGPRMPVTGRPWPAALVAVAAALVVGIAAAAVAGAAVWRGTAEDRRLAAHYRHTLRTAHGDHLQAAPLLGADGAEVGTVFAYQGEPSWLYVTFRAGPEPGTYDVALVTAGGGRLPLRAFTATAGSTGWGSTVRVDIDQVRTLRFTGSGLPAMTADLT